jgi:hypothetical protein
MPQARISSLLHHTVLQPQTSVGHFVQGQGLGRVVCCGAPGPPNTLRQRRVVIVRVNLQRGNIQRGGLDGTARRALLQRLFVRMQLPSTFVPLRMYRSACTAGGWRASNSTRRRCVCVGSPCHASILTITRPERAHCDFSGDTRQLFPERNVEPIRFSLTRVKRPPLSRCWGRLSMRFTGEASCPDMPST